MNKVIILVSPVLLPCFLPKATYYHHVLLEDFQSQAKYKAFPFTAHKKMRMQLKQRQKGAMLHEVWFITSLHLM